MTRTLTLDPVRPGDFEVFLATDAGWGVVGLRDNTPFVDVVEGTIAVDRILRKA